MWDLNRAGERKVCQLSAEVEPTLCYVTVFIVNLVNQDVLRLYIPVHDAHLVAVGQSLQNLPQNIFDGGKSEPLDRFIVSLLLE